MTAGWIFVSGGVILFAAAAAAVVFRWAPRRWGGQDRYQAFALVVASLGIAIVSYGITELTVNPVARYIFTVLTLVGWATVAATSLRTSIQLRRERNRPSSRARSRGGAASRAGAQRSRPRR